ncbi:transmembrane protein 154 [Tachyglossus aculeatus]|uniref:transmembrane protein 154 n=1 Tax=Tachyglossus aculeatus TaxID=9261 RepID=UPI0018F6A5EB|nr:transmembrane protein 154 [Tachyglossus aculeatus]
MQTQGFLLSFALMVAGGLAGSGWSESSITTYESSEVTPEPSDDISKITGTPTVMPIPPGGSKESFELSPSPSIEGSVDAELALTTFSGSGESEGFELESIPSPDPGESRDLDFTLKLGIPVVLLILLSLLTVSLVRCHNRRKSKQVPSSQGSQNALQTYDLGSENIKSPIFEEDTPSVMEIEMEELDKWMNSINKNAECECLPTLQEEKESNNHPSDNES